MGHISPPQSGLGFVTSEMSFKSSSLRPPPPQHLHPSLGLTTVPPALAPPLFSCAQSRCRGWLESWAQAPGIMAVGGQSSDGFQSDQNLAARSGPSLA